MGVEGHDEVGLIEDRSLTAERAAERWAYEAFEDEARQVAEWNGDRFRLVGGLRWYRIVPCPHGWLVLVQRGLH